MRGPQCCMLILRNGNVDCVCILLFLMSHVESKEITMSHVTIVLAPVACHYTLCRMSNLRNAHVALLILGVKGHSLRSALPIGET